MLFFVAEGRLRSGPEARSRVAGSADRGTTRYVGAAFGGSLLIFVLASLLAWRGIAALPEQVGWMGVALTLSGLALRLWAARVLGASYTRTLRVREAQRLLRSGPYAVVRHPGYAGSMLMWIGASLASRELAGIVAIGLLLIWAYATRVAAEERMLEDAFGDEFRAYARTTWRLVPFLY